MASFHLEDTETYKLIVNVIKATDLLGADIGGKSDPYVAVGWAYSREKHKPKTKVIKKNLNPEWDETFELTHNTRCGSKLEFCVYDKKLIGKDEFLGHALVDLHTLLENSGKQMELKLTPALHTKKHKKEKIKGTLTVKVTFPSQLFEDLETLKQLQEMSKMNASDLENIWKIFNEFSGKKDVLKDKRDIINLAKKANVPQKLNNLLVDFSMLPTELLKNIERVDMMSDDDLYAYVMQLFDTNKDGDLALKEFVMGMVMLSKTSDAEKAELRFNLYDKSGTGVLSEEELKLMQRDYARVGKGFFIGFLGFALKKVLGNTFTASQIDELIRDLANTLFTDEFNQKGFELMKQNIDLNHDGTISKEEYIRFCCDEEIQAKYREEVSKAIQPVLDRFTREGSRLIQQWVLTHFLH